MSQRDIAAKTASQMSHEQISTNRLGTSCSWTTGCLSLCSNTMLLIESIYTKLLTHPKNCEYNTFSNFNMYAGKGPSKGNREAR